MKLAVLGTDPDVTALVAAAIAAGHTVVWLGEVRPVDAADLAKLLPGRTASTDWESLLDHEFVDAVLIGRGTAPSELRAEQLKRLVTDAVPILVVQPSGTSVLPYYEVDMARRESHGVVRHYVPDAASPALFELASRVKSGKSDIGLVHQIICQRFVTDTGRDSVLCHLARDVESLRDVAGDVRSVSAVGPKPTDTNYASLQVHMTGRGQATLRWSVAPAIDARPRAEWTLIGDRGTVHLVLPEVTTTAGEETVSFGDRTETHPTVAWNAPATAIGVLVAALPANATDDSDSVSTWSQATAAMEIVDAIELSLQKGRTIEVLQQQLTEQLAFRGAMAAIGCGVILTGTLVLLLIGVVGNVETLLRRPVLSSWPTLLLAALVFFLLLQVIPWLSTKRRPRAPDRDDR